MTMTGSAATSVVYEPDGLQTRFPVPFPVFDVDDVRAIAVEGAEQAELANFVVEGLGSEEGVHVRFFSPPSFGPKVVLYRWTKRVQESEYPEGGRFPAKVVETDFDRLVAMAQEVDDQLAWTLHIPRGADMTPEEYTGSIFTAADASRAAAAEATAAATASGVAAHNARDMAQSALDEAGKAALMAESAARSALEAATLVNQGVADASETTKGIVRLATAVEHANGVSGLAATPAHVKALCDGLRTEISEDIEAVRAGTGLPLLTVIWSATGLAESGFLALSLDHGLLERSAYPAAFAVIQQAYAAMTGAVVDDAAWLAELAANGGVCGKFSLGDGESTFRLPLLGKRAGFGFPDAATDAAHGGFLPDQMRPITGGTSTAPQVGFASCSGAFYKGVSANKITGDSGTRGYALMLNTALLGTNYDGDITHGPLIVYTPLIKIQ